MRRSGGGKPLLPLHLRTLIVLPRPRESVQVVHKTNSNAEELKMYKELLDSGVISQAEFDAKKKQLLDL